MLSPRTHRQYTAEQKSQYVRLATESGKPVSQVAKELDLTESILRKWIKQAQIDQTAPPEGSLTTEERKELTRLRREVKRLEQERAFLTAGASSRQSRPTDCRRIMQSQRVSLVP